MIVFDLSCDAGHRFEGWFGSSQDFANQQGRGLVACPQCGSDAVAKAPMAPAVPAKTNARSERRQSVARPQDGKAQVSNAPLPPEVAQAFRALAKAQAKALKHSTWVGEKFAETARSMHYGDATEAPIHGQATRDEAQALADEGITVAPVLFPVAPPDELN